MKDEFIKMREDEIRNQEENNFQILIYLNI